MKPMSDEELEARLRGATFSQPSVRFDELTARGAAMPQPRDPGLLRLAAATVLVWVMVFAAQAVVTPGIDAFGGSGQQVIAERPQADEGRAGLAYLQQRALFEESSLEPEPAQAHREESKSAPVREGFRRDERRRLSEVCWYV